MASLISKELYINQFLEKYRVLHHTRDGYLIISKDGWNIAKSKPGLVVAYPYKETQNRAYDLRDVVEVCSPRSVPSHVLQYLYENNVMNILGTTGGEIRSNGRKALENFYPYELVKYFNGSAYYYVSLEDAKSIREHHRKDIVVTHAVSGSTYIPTAYSMMLVSNWNDIPVEQQESIIQSDIFKLNLRRKFQILSSNDEAESDKFQYEFNPVSTQPKTTQVMTNPFGNLKFGAIADAKLALSLIGMVIRQDSGGYMGFNPETGELTDVGDFIFNINNSFFLVPTQELKRGDLINEDGKYCFVIEVAEDGSYKVVGQAGIEYKKLKKTNLFGMQFFGKVVSMWDLVSGKEDAGPMNFGKGEFNPMMFLLMSGKTDQFGTQSGVSGGLGSMMEMMLMQQFLKPAAKKAPVKRTRKRKK